MEETGRKMTSDNLEKAPEHVSVISQPRKSTTEEAVVQISSRSNSNSDTLVTWDGEDDPANPKNWSQARKWTITILTSIGGLVCLMSSTMLAPALQDIAKDLDVSQAEANMTLSIFVLAFAFGPMVLAPLTEVFGRRNIWLVTSVWYAVWSVVCGFAKSNRLLLAGRLMSGFGISAEYAIGQPVLADLWSSEERGTSFAIATFIPLLGPAIGPILGGVVAGSIGWRWIFWILAAFDACFIIAAFYLFPETYNQLILQRKAIRLSKETGRSCHTEFALHQKPLSTKLKTSLLRPCRLLITQSIIQIMSLFLAINFGTLYFVLSSYASLWTDQYHESVTISGLHYLALAIGYTIAAQGGARVTDRIWQHFKWKAGGQTAPEYRAPLMLPGILLIPTGLLWYGWAAESHRPWALVDAGAVIFGTGIILSTQAMQQYVMESFREHVASAAAASQFLRSIFAFCFPLFAPALYMRLGYGWGNTTLALVFVVLGISGPFVLWFYGARLRAKGCVVR